MASCAQLGVTTVFQVSASQSTQLCSSNGSRAYVIIVNPDLVSTVFIGFGTNNAVTTSMIPIMPSTAAGISFLEIQNPPKGDIAAIANYGTPTISVTEE